MLRTAAADRAADLRQVPGLALRWLRGSVVGSASVALAAGGHVLGGGAVPATTALLLTAGAVCLGVALSHRRWTLAPLLVVLLGTQVVCHVVLGGHGSGAASLHHAAAGGTPTGAAGPMLAAHVGAALVTAWLLRCGEDCCARLVELLTATWRVATVRVRSRTRRAPSVTCSAVPSVRTRELEHVLARRGPPAYAVA